MHTPFKYIVVGRGMMGSAAARHLSQTTDGVALIGPDEPKDAGNHNGVFGSHYDEARITRTIDPDPVWARLANRSIARYAQIEQESGIRFYHEAGCLMVGPERASGHSYIEGILSAAEQLGVQPELLDDPGLISRFGYFGFESGSEGVFEARSAGYVNPRALVSAQSEICRKQGATLIAETVGSIRRDGNLISVQTREGSVYRAERVLLAAGGFSIVESLLPQPVQMSVYGRTVTFFEIPESELPAFAGMPSLIYEPRDTADHIYLLPPVRYPDGKIYLKIGGDPDDLKLGSLQELQQWFRSGGREVARDHHARIIRSLVPQIDVDRISTGACVVAKTATAYPFIDFTEDPAIAVVTGGCGSAAKSSDEIGRLGAQLIKNGSLEGEGYPVSFAAHFA
ncbi:FAD-dependent oxidoreductase [Rhizobium sp. Root149]|uniref:FAD-dependent oxidoreductase n=1 Tax=Rhizobium sp. Root149 TaxID=1736473 RepID=UPI00071545B3|nr:FAD-dependent oxidoreductase [Rhizobium sp. Root149]KQZ54689.1 FAD-dependent oxidoreductase [Rhizobium sp. Root149]